MWLIEIILFVLFWFICFGIINHYFGYNEDFNFQKANEDLIYPTFLSSMVSLFVSTLIFYFSEQILSLLISLIITIFSLVMMIKLKLAKKNNYWIDRFENDKNERFVNFNKKLKELKKDGWKSGKIHSSKEGKEIKIIDPNGNKKYFHVLTLASKFKKFEKTNLKSTNSESIIAVPKLELSAKLYYDLDGYFYSDYRQKIMTHIHLINSHDIKIKVINGVVVQLNDKKLLDFFYKKEESVINEQLKNKFEMSPLELKYKNIVGILLNAHERANILEKDINKLLIGVRNNFASTTYELREDIDKGKINIIYESKNFINLSNILLRFSFDQNTCVIDPETVYKQMDNLIKVEVLKIIKSTTYL